MISNLYHVSPSFLVTGNWKKFQVIAYTVLTSKKILKGIIRLQTDLYPTFCPHMNVYPITLFHHAAYHRYTAPKKSNKLFA
jgi:hypothetical protein